MFNLGDYLILGLFIIILIIIIFFTYKLVYTWIIKKKYTREYFAFYGVSIISSLAFLTFSYIFGIGLWQRFLVVFVKALNKIFNLEIIQNEILKEPDFSDKVLAFFIFLSINWVIIYLFKHWNGTISTRQFEETLKREKASIVNDFIAFVRKEPNIFKTDKNKIDDKENYSFNIEKFEAYPWKIQAAKIVKLIFPKYKLNVDENWYEEVHTYIIDYEGLDKKICLLCKRTVENKDVERLISFFKNSHVSVDIHSIIIIYSDVCKVSNPDQVAIQIEFYDREKLLENLINIDDYSNYIIRKFESEEILEGNPTCLNDIYTMPICLKHQRNDLGKEFTNIKNVENYLQEWLSETNSKKQITVLGEYGQGKSVLAHRICYLIFKKTLRTDRIPILIELRAKFPKQYTDKFGLLIEWAHAHYINPEALILLLHQGKLLLIFDGFDEMELVGDYSIRLEHFRKIWEYAIPNSKFIITGRPNFFLNDSELVTLLRTHDSQANSFYCEEIVIKNFDTEKIKEALRSAKENVKKDILETIKTSGKKSSFFDLISRPTHLFMASVVWEEKLSKHKANINSAIVYKEFLTYCYERQLNKNIKTPLSASEREYFMQGIATKMVCSSGYTNLISFAKFQETVEKLYNGFPEEVNNKDQVFDNAQPLQKRFSNRYAFDTVFQDIRSCGVLVRDLATHDSFKFAHKSFQEYLVSEFYVSYVCNYEGYESSKAIANSIVNSLELDVDRIEKTPEVFNFVADLLSVKLTKLKAKDNCDKIGKIFKLIYPYKRISIKYALLLRPILKLQRLERIFLISLIVVTSYMLFTFIRQIILYQNFNLSLVAKFIFIVLLGYVLFAKFIKKKEIGIGYIEFDENSSEDHLTVYNKIVDSDNLLLWFFVCNKIQMPNEDLEKFVNKKRILRYQEEVKSLINPISINDSKE